METLKKTLYVDNWSEFLEVGSWVGVIIFWLTFWLPKGFFLLESKNLLEKSFPELILTIPFFALGIMLVFATFLAQKFRQKDYLKTFLPRLKVAVLWLGAMFFFAIFSRDFWFSSSFIIIWILGVMASFASENLVPNNSLKKSLMLSGLFLGFLAFKFLPAWGVSAEILSLVATLGVVFWQNTEKFATFSRNWWGNFFAKIFLFFLICQGGSWLFPILTLGILFFPLHNSFRQRRNFRELGNDLWIFLAVFLFYIYFNGLYAIDLQNVFPAFSLNFREIFMGVGMGQFLPILQHHNEFLLNLNYFQLPSSGLLLNYYEIGVLGVFAIILFFLFANYLFPKRSKTYLLLIFLIWLGSAVFFATENGLILFVFLLFLNPAKKISIRAEN